MAYDPESGDDLGGISKHISPNMRVEIDYVLYSTYDAQVDANLSGEVDVAWNSPLAWVKSQIVSGGSMPRDRHARFRPRPHDENHCAREFDSFDAGRSEGQDAGGRRVGFSAGHTDSAGNDRRVRASIRGAIAACSTTT